MNPPEPRTVPQHIDLTLNKMQRGLMEDLLRTYADFDFFTVLYRVIDKGLAELSKGGAGITPQQKQKIEEKVERGPAAPNFASGRRRIAQAITPHRHVERYVGFPITEKVRRSIENFLTANPQMDEETTCAALLQLGLDHAEIELQDTARAKAERAVEMAEARTRKATENVRIAERLYRRAFETCKS
jgi:hypothetical protein